MDMQGLLQNLAELNTLKAELKRCTMIYHYQEKCSIAWMYGITPQTFFDMPYVEYETWQHRYHADLECRPAMPEEVLPSDVQQWLDDKRANRAIGVA
jgi:hypothetical protein